MRYLLYAALAALTQVTSTQAREADTTVIVYVTVPRSNSPTPAPVLPQAQQTETHNLDSQPTPSSSPPESAAIVPQDKSTEAEVSSGQPTPSSSASQVTLSTSTSVASQSSIPSSEATSSQAYPEVTAAPKNEPDYYEPEVSSLGAGEVDTAGGASGSDSSAFHLSKGGLAAILIVVILVGLFGSK